MLYEKIMRASKALKKIESLPPEEQSIVDLARAELMDAADQAQELEQNVPVGSEDPPPRRPKGFAPTGVSG